MYTEARTTESRTTEARTTPAQAADGSSPTPGSRSQAAYHELKHRLLLGDFPLTDRLGEARLGTLLGVSRTPVREALARLHTEALVERHPEGGYRPTPPDLRRTHELYEVRFALELHALHLPRSDGIPPDSAAAIASSEGRDPGGLVALRDEWADLAARHDLPPSPEFVLLDEDFHVRLAQAAGNEALVDTLVATNERIRPVRMHDFLTPERIDVTVEQHLGILDALIAGEIDTSARLLEEHLRQSLDVVEARAAAALARMMGASRPSWSTTP